ncbi:SLBB domain-containing protein [Chthonomonas calidirosea]|uniref:SLBB domain-containing protein n=1 Tax=Chthonomonas calidirosea TaxID=454171 RepID=UPI0006EC98EC|nr:SLBB domain-containing protein [Chthonomonas calidirosea]CEK20570.1 periplasmic protein involved in polysaccharide export [Chthonomonas calidirosea]
MAGRSSGSLSSVWVRIPGLVGFGLGLLGVSLGPSQPVYAQGSGDQNPPSTSGTTVTPTPQKQEEDLKALQKQQQTPVAPPANPLVQPTDSSGKGLNGTPNKAVEQTLEQSLKDFGDYSPNPPDARTVKRPEDLPLFGYDFFEPAREYILARRAFLMQYYPYLKMTIGGAATSSATAPTSSALPTSNLNTTGATTVNPTPPASTNAPTSPQPSQPTVPPATGATSAPQSLLEPLGAMALGAGATRQTIAPSENPENATSASGVGNSYPYAAPYSYPYAPYTNMPPMMGFPYGTPSYSSYGGQPNGVYGIPPTQQSGENAINAYNGVADPLEQMVFNIISSPPLNYQLFGGDVVVVRYSNPAMEPRVLTLQVSPQGELDLGKDGRVNVAGMTLAQAEQALRAHLSRYYRNVDVSISLSRLRTISVTVMGHVFAPGTYIVPAVATAFNVLYAAGGPTKDGSFRDIEVRRGNKVLPLDLYQLMADLPSKGGTSRFDIPLQPGDVIFVPGTDERVYAMGEVRSPACYELKQGETLADLLRLAGGVRAAGVSHAVQVITVQPGKARVIHTVDLADSAAVAHFRLYDGDIVNVLQLRPTLENLVRIDGAVAQPSAYALTPGMRVADLVQMAGGPLSEAYLQRAALYRWSPSGVPTYIPINLAAALEGDPTANIPLQRWDKLEVYTVQQAAFMGERKVTVRGDVQRPGVYQYSEGMHLSDLLLKAGGPLPDAALVVDERQNGDGSKRYYYATIEELQAGDSQKNILVHDNDVVAVYTEAQAQYMPAHKVVILGLVNAPGQYDRGEDMHLSDLLRLAGGLLPNASNQIVIAHARQFVSGNESPTQTVMVTRGPHGECVPDQDPLLRDGDVVTVPGVGHYQEKPMVAYIQGQVEHPGPYIITKTTRLSDLVRMAGGLTKEAFPEGAQFNRNPDEMASPEQKQLARVISDLSDLYNQSDYKRQLALSDLERIKAAGNAATSSVPLTSNGQAAGSSAAATLALELSKRDLVSPPRVLGPTDLQPNGNIAINLPDALKHPGGPNDLLLADGDQLTIPTIPTTVQVIGAVVQPRGVIYRKGEGIFYYVNQAGGYAPDAAIDHIVVIHAGGGLTPGYKVRSLEPGDLIFVPTKVLAAKLSGGGNNIEDFFRSLTTSAIIFRIATGLVGL